MWKSYPTDLYFPFSYFACGVLTFGLTINAVFAEGDEKIVLLTLAVISFAAFGFMNYLHGYQKGVSTKTEEAPETLDSCHATIPKSPKDSEHSGILL